MIISELISSTVHCAAAAYYFYTSFSYVFSSPLELEAVSDFNIRATWAQTSA